MIMILSNQDIVKIVQLSWETEIDKSARYLQAIAKATKLYEYTVSVRGYI